MYHQFFSCIATSATPGQTGEGSDMFRIQVDTKAMRKFNADQTLMAVIDVVEVGTAVMQFHFNSRMLTKLP